MKLLRTARKILVTSALLISNFVTVVVAEGNLERGKELSSHCAGCHGETGISPISTNPNLAGQKHDYLVYALKAYRSRERTGGMAFIMHGNAARLSDQDIEDLAAYFTAQK